MARHEHRRSLSAAAAVILLVASSIGVGTAAAAGPTVFTVTTADDLDGTTCGTACSLRQAINAANLDAEATARIVFAIPSGPTTIQPLTGLPPITHPIDIDGRTQAGIVLDGSSIGDASVNGLHIVVGGSGSAVAGLEIEGFSGSGILIDGAHDTAVGGELETDPTAGNVIHDNGEHGVSVVGDATSVHNTILGNRIYANGGTGIDVGGQSEGTVGCPVSGVAPGPNSYQCAPSIAIGPAPITTVDVHAFGRSGAGGARVELFWAPTCALSESGLAPIQATTYVGAVQVPLVSPLPGMGGVGDATFTLLSPLTGGFLTATTTAADGTSQFAPCVQILTPTAERIDATSVPLIAAADQPATMSFTMSNDGPYRDEQAYLTVDLTDFPSSLIAADGPTEPCLLFGLPVVICAVTGLDPGETATVTIDLTPTTDGTWTVVGSIYHLDGADAADTLTATIVVGGATAVGTSVTVGSGGPDPTVELTFAGVTSAGTTTVTAQSPVGPLPAGYLLGGQAVAYDIVTTAGHTGPITVCLSTGGLVPVPDSILHFDGGAWIDITTLVDAPGQRVCGTTTSLSPFVLADRADAPGAPTSVAATALDHGAHVSWVPPSTDGGAPITGYVVTASPGGATAAAGPTATTATVGGLTNGTTYTFTVAATNLAGTGEASAPSNPVVPVAPANQQITFPNPGAKTMVQSPVVVTPTASSGLPVTVTSSSPQVCTASGSNGTTITFLGAGLCTLVASQAGNAAWNPAPTVSRTFLVSRAVQAITFSNPGAKTMAESPMAVTPTASSGLAVTVSSGTPLVCATGGPNGTSITLLSPGACTLVASQAGNGSWLPALPVIRIFAVSKATQTITFANPGPRSLANPNVIVTPTASSGLPVSLASTTTRICTAGGSTITLLRIGTCRVVASQPGNAVYASAPAITQSFSVAP